MTWILALVIVWLVFLTALVLSTRSHYNRLTKLGGKNLDSVLESILHKLKTTSEDTLKADKTIKNLLNESENYIQKVGLVRFNPFPDTGGNQSFAIAVLNHKKNGIVITSMHSRANTRWYIKKIISGKSIDAELSKEEENAIKEAK